MNSHKSTTQTRNENIANNMLYLCSSLFYLFIFPLQVATALNFVCDVALQKVCMYICSQTYIRVRAFTCLCMHMVFSRTLIHCAHTQHTYIYIYIHTQTYIHKDILLFYLFGTL